MKKLKITWLEGAWTSDGGQPIASAEIPGDATPGLIGETLVFSGYDASGEHDVFLMIPEGRLVSVLSVEVEA